jgi:hypothetical protein
VASAGREARPQIAPQPVISNTEQQPPRAQQLSCFSIAKKNRSAEKIPRTKYKVHLSEAVLSGAANWLKMCAQCASARVGFSPPVPNLNEFIQNTICWRKDVV